MSEEQSAWNIGDETNGYRWSGAAWERIWKPGDVANGHRFDGEKWVADMSCLQ